MCRLFRCLKKAVTFGLLCAFITFCPGIPPNAKFVPYGDQLKAPLKLTLDPIINNAERLLEGQLVGPEGFAVHKGALYTGLHGGHVVKVLPNKILPVVKTGKQCDGIYEEHLCGRPLGLKVKHDVLYIADAYYGIFSHVISGGAGNINHLLESNIEVNGKPVKTINSLDVHSDGTIYFTSSSSEFDIKEGVSMFLASSSGRLLKLDPTTKKVTQLLDNLYFTNGLALSSDEEYLFIAETMTRKVLKYHIKTGNVVPFIEGLPGMPDNIQYAGDNTYWVALVTPTDEERPSLVEVFADWPNIRKFLARLLFLAEFPFQLINQYYPNKFCQIAMHHIGHLGPIFAILPEEVNVVRFDGKSGQILETLHGNNGVVKAVSDVAVLGDYMYFGSPITNFIGRVMLPKGKYAQTEEAAKFQSGSQAHVKKATEEAQAKKAAEEAQAKKAAEEAQAKKAAEDAQAKKAAEEAKKAAEEAKAKKAAEEAKAKKAAEEAKAKKAAEEAKAKKAAEEAKAKKAAEEAKAKKAAEEAKAIKAAEEAKAKKAAEEAQAKKLAEEAKAKKAAEDAKKAAEAAAKFKANKIKEAASNKKTSDEVKTNKISDDAGKSKVAGDKSEL